MVAVAMIAMMSNLLTRETLLKVTMSMMTTVLLRDHENDWSSIWSLQCCCLLLVWVARPCSGLCSDALLQE